MTHDGAAVQRINPGAWSTAAGFDQAQVRSTPARLLTASSVLPVDERGDLLHEGDPAAQLALALANAETVLAEGGMDLGDVLHLTVHTVELDAVLADLDVLTDRLAPAGATPPVTLVGVARLVLRGALVELGVTAGR